MASSTSFIENPSQPLFGANFVDTAKTIDWFRAQDLLQKQISCPKCKRLMKEYNKNQLQDGKIFHCSPCNNYQQSIRSGTMFLKSTLSLASLAYLALYFCNDVPVFIASRLLGSSVSYKCIIQWYYKLRNMCSKRLLMTPLKFTSTDVALLTAEGTVEIDESLFGKKAKAKGGKPSGTSCQKYSVFGIVEKSGRRCVLCIIPDRKRETLFEIITKHIDTSCKIIHDGFASYATLGNIGYEDSTVCHNLEFVTPDGIHTNTIEGLWGLIKQRISRMHGLPSFQSLAALLDDFSYRQIYADTNGSIWNTMLADIKQLGPSMMEDETA